MLRRSPRLLASLFFGLAASCSRDKTARPPDGPVEWALDDALPFDRGTTQVMIDCLRGTGPSDIWALAQGHVNHNILRFAFHFDGTHWSRVDDVPVRTALWPVAPDDVWAVGAQGRLAHWDGKAWTLYRAPGVDTDFLDVWAAPGSDVWIALGGSEVMHFDGRGFERLSPPELQGKHNSIQRLTGIGDQVLVPVNSLDEPSRMARRVEAGWSREDVGVGGIAWVAASAPDDLWAMSMHHQGFHYDGKGWTRHETSPLEVRAVSTSGPGEAYLVGDKGLIMRWDGTAWRHSPSGTTAGLWSVYAPPGGRPIAGGDRLYRLR